MTKYTLSQEADKKIEKDIQIIKNIILEKFKPDIKAIVLFGGFGHRGGSFKKISNKIIPLNDYDLYIINKKQISGEKLEKVGEQCSKALGRGGLEIVENFNEKYDEDKFFHVDLHCLTENNLKKLKPTQRSFDLKTSLVIYGKLDILDKIPEIEISRSDAIRLLFNKLNHFAIAEKNSEKIKSIYAVKGFTDSASALLIFYGIYDSDYLKRVEKIKELEIPEEYKQFVQKATDAKLKKGYQVENTEEFFAESKKWVEWIFKKILKEQLKIKSNDWIEICKIMYNKLPYSYFNKYLKSDYLFFGQYYLNVRFFLEGLRKKEFLPKSLLRWKDAGLILGIAMMLYSFDEYAEAEKYLNKLTSKTNPLKERLMKLYSIYYLQKLI